LNEIHPAFVAIDPSLARPYNKGLARPYRVTDEMEFVDDHTVWGTRDSA
jgi:hypothetical protein